MDVLYCRAPFFPEYPRAPLWRVKRGDIKIGEHTFKQIDTDSQGRRWSTTIVLGTHKSYYVAPGKHWDGQQEVVRGPILVTLYLPFE